MTKIYLNIDMISPDFVRGFLALSKNFRPRVSPRGLHSNNLVCYLRALLHNTDPDSIFQLFLVVPVTELEKRAKLTKRVIFSSHDTTHVCQNRFMLSSNQN